MPRRFLCDVQSAVKLHAGRALELGREQVLSNRPHLIREVGIFQHGALANTDHRPVRAFTATVRHAFVLDN